MFGQGNVDKDESFHKEPAEKVFSGLVFVDLLNIMFFLLCVFPIILPLMCDMHCRECHGAVCGFLSV